MSELDLESMRILGQAIDKAFKLEAERERDAIGRIEKLIEVIKETRAESTGMTLVLHELNMILEILKGKYEQNKN